MARAQNSFPEGNELTAQIHSRHRRGNIWRVLFQIATVVGIVALALLLYNIVNSSFGYTAVQNAIEPAALTLAYDEDQLLRLANTVSSEDDNQLAAEIMADPYAIGFFGYAYYQENEATLRALAVDGVQPGRRSRMAAIRWPGRFTSTRQSRCWRRSRKWPLLSIFISAMWMSPLTR